MYSPIVAITLKQYISTILEYTQLLINFYNKNLNAGLLVEIIQNTKDIIIYSDGSNTLVKKEVIGLSRMKKE